MHIGRPFWRALRAAVFAVACVLVSAALHVLAGGAPVSAGTLAVALVLTWAGAFLLARRQRGLDVLLVACFAAQYGLHHLFLVGAMTGPSSPWTDEHGTGLGMLLIHATMAVFSAFTLERGETALATIVHLAVTSVHALLAVIGLLLGAPADIVPHRHGRVPDTRSRAPRRSDFGVVVSRRGPPLSLSVL
ncbi:hypothetical protein Sme01_34170 [Sphaerisporangium melleum]|uniref:Uncharacterized protein n=1 Tax=Sphaerisporangium melleum TaxID=321316 RepID=A0A917QXP1_9ACTN|nr:hypothetical protein [Sphaerisporangium melleum]GGK74608.1 hypothetical protein GCM10007964_16850 [Sphaerisporangium melleum]GII70941.1 hypothetical protein Sme01_34170 [Sphaerisporangium melleum]